MKTPDKAFIVLLKVDRNLPSSDLGMEIPLGHRNGILTMRYFNDCSGRGRPPYNASFKNRPVCVRVFATCSGVRSATTRPPPAAPSGPRSIIQSTHRITSRLCSIITMLPPF